jgi:hypothetical protein
MEYMFTMMNNARLNVGLLGLGTGERAYQQARDFARERVQGRDIAGSAAAVTIIHHPDVRRMLMTMKAQTEAMRTMTYFCAYNLDMSKRHADEAERARHQTLIDLLTPICKSWCTDTGCDVASTGVQVHGGMGFIEETGAAQHFRDARIHPIYEGTNGIQANDLLGRKLMRDGGEAARAFIAEMRALDRDLAAAKGDDIAAIRSALKDGLGTLEQATGWMLATFPKDVRLAAAGAVHYLNLFGNVMAGWLMAKSALAAAAALGRGAANTPFYEAKLATCRFFVDLYLPRSAGLLHAITHGGGKVMALAEEQF